MSESIETGYTKLGKAVRERVLDTREARYGDMLRDMHPAQRDRIVPSVDLSMEDAARVLDSIFAMVLRGDDWEAES